MEETLIAEVPAAAALAGTDAPAGDHTHHWFIGEQGQATSHGICSCGAEKEFTNVWPDRQAGQMVWPGRRHPMRR